MSDPLQYQATPNTEISVEALKKAEEFIEEEEGASHKLKGWMAVGLTAIAVLTTVFHLYVAYGIVPTQQLRAIHVGLILFLSFLMFPIAKRFRHRIMWWDVILALLSVGVPCASISMLVPKLPLSFWQALTAPRTPVLRPRGP